MKNLGDREWALAEPREKRVGWTIPVAAVVGIGGFLATLSLLFIVTREFWGADLLLGWTSNQRSLLFSLLSLLGTCGLIVPFLLLIARRRYIGNWWDSIQWNASHTAYWSLLAGAAVAIANQLALRIFLGTAGSYHDYPLTLSLTLYFLAAVCAQPIIEEFYFRGMLFLALSKRLGDLASILIVTVIFVFLHPKHRFYVLPPAIGLGVVRLKTRSVAACFAFHAAYNLFLALYQLAAPS